MKRIPKLGFMGRIEILENTFDWKKATTINNRVYEDTPPFLGNFE